MAIAMMQKVCKEISQKWSQIRHIAIHHRYVTENSRIHLYFPFDLEHHFVYRLGEVPVGEASVVIAISSPHRKDSLEALHYAIDRLKQIVPIFKKEQYTEGDAQWKQNEECSWAQCG